MISTTVIHSALRTLRLEAEGIAGLQQYIDGDFEKVVERLYGLTGRVIISGVGKSAIVAQKIVATLNSTGTPSLYMHAADAIHGDLGMITEGDAVILISKSGNSPEIKVLVPLLKKFGNYLIGMVGNAGSYLAKNADAVLNTTVANEACPNNLAPTTSTTAQMAMGDAIAVCLMELRGFNNEDFARFHPGGMLGKQLYLRVADLIADNAKPAVSPATLLPETVIEMTAGRLGATAVLRNDGTVYGIITDGDLRRMLERREPIAGVTAADICSKSPKTITPETLAVNALEVLRNNDITHLVVVQDDQYAGILHLHDLVKEGLI